MIVQFFVDDFVLCMIFNYFIVYIGIFVYGTSTAS